MDNHINLRSYNDNDTNILVQQSDEPDSTDTPQVNLSSNSFKNVKTTKNECEVLKNVNDEKSVFASKTCELKNNNDNNLLKHDRTSSDGFVLNAEGLTKDLITSLDNDKYSTEIGGQCPGKEGSQNNLIDDNCEKSVRVENLTGQDGSNSLETKHIENSSDNSNLSTCIASTSCLEQAQSISQLPLYGKSLINPVPNEFDMIEENVLPVYDTLLLQRNSCVDSFLSEPDDSVVISNNNAIPQTESVVASNFSLDLLKSYESDESSDGEACEVSHKYREGNDLEDSDKDSDSDSSSTSSSSSILISDSTDSEGDELYENIAAKPSKPIKGRKELDLEDLPPIKDLKISVPEEECTAIGKVFQIVDRLVVVQAFKDIPAYNLDTVLFVEGGHPLGRIFDVFGPVTEPLYCIRFNSREHIQEKNITIDQMVYAAPKTKYTNYVFLAQLMKLKGSDASWEDDCEPPEIYLEYSDDEQEQRAKKNKSKNRKAVFRVDTDPDEPARKRHSAYEKRMNERNLQLTAVRNHQNAGKNKMHGFKSLLWSPALTPSESTASNVVRPSVSRGGCHQTFGRPPLFNSTIPPPNVHFGLSPRPCIQSPRPDLRTPPPCFVNPNNTHFSQPFPENRRGTSPGFSNVSMQSCRFPPVGCSSNPPRWMPPVSTCQNLRARSPRTRDGLVTNNTLLPLSAFWSQRPQSSNIPTLFSALPNDHFNPLCTPPRPFWPTQSPPPQTRNMPCNGSSQINFNPNVPPPSPNLFNH